VDKKSIVADLKASVGGASLLNITEIAKYMGRSRNRLKPFLEGLEYLQMGTEKKYLVIDIAKKIVDESRITK